MKVVRRRDIFSDQVLLILNKRELATLRRAEAIAEEMREHAEKYLGKDSSFDLEIARAEHGVGSLADEGPEYTLKYHTGNAPERFADALARGIK